MASSFLLYDDARFASVKSRSASSELVVTRSSGSPERIERSDSPIRSRRRLDSRSMAGSSAAASAAVSRSATSSAPSSALTTRATSV